MYDVMMAGVPYLHEDLPEGEFETLEAAIDHADEMVFECFVMDATSTILYNNGMPNAEEFEVGEL